MDIQPFSATTLSKMAACRAVGLEYWSDHPATGCMWAVDGNQQAHVVRWYRKTNEAALQVQREPRKYRDADFVWRTEYPVYDAGGRVRVSA